MIKYTLVCDQDHEFEAWFSNSDSFDAQVGRGFVECPHCGSVEVRKALMAPAVRTSRAKSGRNSVDPGAMAAKIQAHIRNNYDYVGNDFANEARAMHDGDKPERLIYGEASAAERDALIDDGVPVAPLPDALAPTPPKKTH